MRRSAVALIIAASGVNVAAPASPAYAQSETSRAYAIPGGSLAGALNRFADASHFQLVYDGAVTRGVETRGVQGTLAPSEALNQLLAGSGLTYRFTGASSVTIERPVQTVAVGPVPQGDIILAPIEISSNAQSPIGPGVGYTATRTLSGTKTDTPLIETPQSISVITKQQMVDQGVQSVGEALRYTPGVVAEEYGGTDLRIDQYMIRGFANSNPYVDGLTTNGRYTLLAPDVDPYGLERVEVMRGPASILYGQNIPGGLINLVSKRPTETPLREIEVTGLNPAGGQMAFDLSGPANQNGTVLYRMTGLFRDGQTQVDNVNQRRYFFAPAITLAPDKNTTFTVLAKVQRSDDGVLVQNLPAVGTLYNAPFGKIPTNLFIGEPSFNNIQRTTYSIGYSLEHHFSDVFAVRQNLRDDYTTTAYEYVGTGGIEPGTTLLDRTTLGANAHVENFAVDTQGEAKFDTFGVKHTALVGLDYYRSHDRWTEQDGEASPLDVVSPVYGRSFTLPKPDYVTDDSLAQVGAYAQDQIKWNHIVLVGGVRHDWAATTTTDILADDRLAQRDQAFTGRAGAVYLFDSGLAPYFSYSTSFLPAIGSTYDDVPFKPTTGVQYETGVKYQPIGANSFAMLSAFNIDQKNVLTADPDPSHPLAEVQTGAIRVRGLEASAVADDGHGLKAIAAFTYLDGRITQDNSGDIGNIPADIPRYSANFWIDKTLQTGAFHGFGLGGGVRFLGAHFGDNDNMLYIPNVALFDAAVHYDYRNWRLSVNAKNVFDRTYVATCGSSTFCYYGLRRQVLGTVAYRW